MTADSSPRLMLITVRARPETTTAEWHDVVEAIQAALGNAVETGNWGDMEVFGGTAFHDAPTYAVRARLSTKGVGTFLAILANWSPALAVPVRLEEIQGALTSRVGKVGNLGSTL